LKLLPSIHIENAPAVQFKATEKPSLIIDIRRRQGEFE
jgi:hypothetical protein